MDELYTAKSYEELESIVNAWLNDDSDSDGTFRGAESSDSSSNSSESSDKGSSKYKSLDEAFAELDDL